MDDNSPDSGSFTGGWALTFVIANASPTNPVNVLLPAIEKAGKNPTWAKVYKNILASGKGGAAYMSNGEGQFAKNKPYYATQVHLESLNTANKETPKDPTNGTFNGCPAAVNCFVPQLVDGQEWFPVVER